MATFADLIERMAEKYPASQMVMVNDPPPTYRCRHCDDLVIVGGPDEPCEKCKMEQERGYRALVLAGRCANGAELDHGSRNHAVLAGHHAALCGTKPGRRSVGWKTPWQSRDVTCPRCLKKLEKTQL